MTLLRRLLPLVFLVSGVARALAGEALVGFDPARPPEIWKPVLAGLAKVRAVESGFVENRYMRLRKKPFETPGVMRYLPGTGVSIARDDDGAEETVLVKPDGLYRRGDDGTFNKIPYDTAATRAPRLLLSVVGFDAKKVARDFTAEGRVDGRYWTLELRPRSPEIAAVVSRLRVTGFDDRLMSITLYDGDRVRLEILIRTVAFPASFPADVRKKYFGE